MLLDNSKRKIRLFGIKSHNLRAGLRKCVPIFDKPALDKQIFDGILKVHLPCLDSFIVIVDFYEKPFDSFDNLDSWRILSLWYGKTDVLPTLTH
jgi:hypothetical protein